MKCLHRRRSSSAESEPSSRPIPIFRPKRRCARSCSNGWVNERIQAHGAWWRRPKAVAVKPGQFFNLLCPSPDVGRAVAAAAAERLSHRPRQWPHRVPLQVRGARHAHGLATRASQATCSTSSGRSASAFTLDPAWKNIVVLGRGVGLATLATDLAARRREWCRLSPRSCPRAARESRRWRTICSGKGRRPSMPVLDSATARAMSRMSRRSSAKA